MKYVLFFLTLFLFVIVGKPVLAQNISPTIKPTIKPTISTTPKVSPSATPTQSSQDSQIEKIKDLVASRVAELKLVDKRGFLGHVKSSTNTQITLTRTNGDQVITDIDELTKFDGGSSESFGISDIKAGDYLSVVGLYNKQTERLLARFARLVTSIPENIEGVVTLKDISEFKITIATGDGKEKVVNIETSTKTSSFEGNETVKSGFSKIVAGQRVIVIGFPSKTNKDEINASRVIHFPNLPLSEKLKTGVEKAKKSN